jgi:shikimate kinase
MMRLSDSDFKPIYRNRWFIWGMPYSGKSSLGKKLQKILPFSVVDLDDEIQQLYKKSPAVIIKESGEPEFRKRESEVLKNKVSQFEEFCLITGGGTPIRAENAGLMLSTGNCLFMDTSLPEMLERFRAKSTQERPLINPGDESGFMALYKSRLEAYQKAHAHFLSEKEALTYFSKLYPGK